MSSNLLVAGVPDKSGCTVMVWFLQWENLVTKWLSKLAAHFERKMCYMK